MIRPSADRRNGMLFVCATLTSFLCLAPPANSASQTPQPEDTIVRQIDFVILQQFQDGAWLVPTLRAFRSPQGWENAMDDWSSRHEMVSREPAPNIDWTKNAVIVLAIGTVGRKIDIKVKQCRRHFNDTIVDLHLETEAGPPDPWLVIEHPTLVISVARADLKSVLLQYDALIEGLPPLLTRTEVIEPPAGPKTPNASSEAAAVTRASGADGSSTWGRVKALYRSAAPGL